MSSRNHFQRALGVATISALVGMLTLAPQGLWALDAELENVDTGADSSNVNDVVADRSISFTFTNTGSVDNDFDYDLNTGGNTVADNTTVGDVATGDIEVEQEVENVVNQPVDLSALNDAITSSSFEAVSIEVRNQNTGASSTNTNTTAVTSTDTVDVTNTATADNTFTLALNTGDNVIERNTTVGDISTGDIKVTGKVTNILNAEKPVQPAAPPVAGAGGGQLGGQPPVTVSSLPTDGPVKVASLPTTPTAVAAAPATQPIKEMTQPKKEFFPAGAAPTLAQYLSLFLLAYLLVYTPEILGRLKSYRFALYRVSAALPIL